MNFNKPIALLTPAILLAGLWVRTLKPKAQPQEPPPPFSFTGDRVILASGSKLLGCLEVVQVGEGASESTGLRAVGQIIALSNASGNLTGETADWVELEPQISSSVGLELTKLKPEEAGIAYGLTTLSAEYATRIRSGQRVEIVRYGLRKSNLAGVITRVIPRNGTGDGTNLVFRFTQGQDWFPGTNCEVVFPVLRGRPVKISSTALIHEGIREYVWKEVAPRQFSAQTISVVDANACDVSVLGLQTGDRIVARGAILLKPLLPKLLSQRRV